MTTPRLPAVRLPSVNGGECVIADGAVLEVPLSSKFSVSWPSETRTVSSPPASERSNLSFSEGESETSDGDSGNEQGDSPERFNDAKSPITPVPARMEASPRSSPAHPQFSRALSMPLPSQLGYLQHPHKSASREKCPSFPATPDSERLKELSVELADSVQMMIQTMLQISPPQLLEPAKEQFSACALSVPTSSMSAILTSMKNLNYISANMAGLCSSPQSPETSGSAGVSRVGTPTILTDFDIGELLQSVGDSLSGTAAQAGVDLVLYHGDDIGLRHVCVKGDEGGISYALSHVVRQVLATTQPGDSIELGLLVGPSDPKSDAQAPLPDDDNSPAASEDPLTCTIRISHKFGTVPASSDAPAPARPQPFFSSLLLQQLLQQIGAKLTPDLPPPELFLDGRTCDFTLSLDRGSLSVMNTPLVTRYKGDCTSGEPSVEQLTLFADALKGKRVTLYANAKGSFAHHLTSYLTAWGMDLTHVSPDGEVDGLPDVPPSPTTLVAPPPGLPPTNTTKPGTMATGTALKDPPSFIFIDDDIEVLKERLNVLRADKPYQLNINLRNRPSLANNHRPRSSPQVARAMGLSNPPMPVVIVHFTSLANYKTIKDVIQSIMASHAGSTTPLPEVMIIPKPAGPRRFLTALHTAVTKPVVDPFFSPIATSPTSPSAHLHGSFFHGYHNSETGNPGSTPKTSRPSGSRSNSDRSTKSAKDLGDHSTHHPPPSPLSIPDNVEYFSEAAAKLGASPSSGLMIQSPDGQPAGIFFHPRGKSPRNVSAHSMERDKGQLQLPEQKRRGSSRLSISDAPTSPMSFSSLHAVATTSRHSPVDSSAAASPVTAARKSTSPREDSTTPIGSPATPRKPSAIETTRKSPPGSPLAENSPITRRATPRKVTQDSNPPSPTATLAAASKKVRASADGNIVPPISVLIVDDNPINQTILSTFMKKKKIKYDLANNGQEAVQKWRTGGFHLILMDIQMPIMDGIQATKEIRRLEKANAVAGYPPGTPSFDDHESPLRTPSDTSTEARSATSPYRSSVIIVALTASSLQSDRVAALAAGCNDFLTKPVSLLWLNSKIIEWGSIKALQMWADLRPEAMSNMSTEQAVQARNVAERLHVPRGRTTPSPSRDENVSPAPSARTLNELAKDLAQGGRRGSAALTGVASSSLVCERPPAAQSPTTSGRKCFIGLAVQSELMCSGLPNEVQSSPTFRVDVPQVQSSAVLKFRCGFIVLIADSGTGQWPGKFKCSSSQPPAASKAKSRPLQKPARR
ncbi:putative cheY-homologous receiver domain containing protein [Lyophyllum shimeji]|uniref:CheY-homologous receiver domain containing protein n=1 Tax=Lyophyllum shimeji TaxID=47721 RepID=A0A9P3PCM7_LYOSH|nr:putative cheY-homologous receiver domain containing protein [Lyophyllum shimeji]